MQQHMQESSSSLVAARHLLQDLISDMKVEVLQIFQHLTRSLTGSHMYSGCFCLSITLDFVEHIFNWLLNTLNSYTVLILGSNHDDHLDFNWYWPVQAIQEEQRDNSQALEAWSQSGVESLRRAQQNASMASNAMTTLQHVNNK
jgi:hypothetical protein